MPLCPRFPPFAHPQRLFHTSVVRRTASPNHYETLQIPPNANLSEVKKSFYTLSKTHHPDRNPNDPSASSRFMRISEAYNILRIPAKRQAYDRSLPSSAPSPSQSHPQGSYHSSNPAGGRPASGLSRRRSQFRGPPPSFYRSGGWGEHGEKRQRAATGEMGKGVGDKMGEEGGMGPGQKAWGWERVDDVRHFDREGHFRTHEKYDKRRRERMSQSEDFVGGGETRGTFANFLFVGGVISLGVFIPSLVFERLTRGSMGEKS